MSEGNYAQRKRQEFISQTAAEGRLINRADLMMTFGIKEACATRDLQKARKSGVILYNTRLKSYVGTPGNLLRIALEEPKMLWGKPLKDAPRDGTWILIQYDLFQERLFAAVRWKDAWEHLPRGFYTSSQNYFGEECEATWRPIPKIA